MNRKLQAKKSATILSFLLPSFLGFMIFIFLPMVMAIGLSFTNYSGGPRFRFVGLKNFSVAFSSPEFWSYLGITFKYMIITVIFQIVLGLAFAMILQHPFKGCGFFRSIYYLPNILSSVAVGLAFMFIFEPSSGLANSLLGAFGIDPLPWLAGENTSMSVIIFVTIWQNFGYYMILFIGGLQNINGSLYEAAEMDGANWWQKFKAVTLPGISPILFFATTMAIIRGFQVFDYVFVMTGGQAGGGPAGSTSVLAFDIYRSAFMHQRFGFASAESVVLMAIILVFTVIQQVGQKKWVTYDIV